MNKVVFLDETLEQTFNELPQNDPLRKSITRAIQKIQEDFKSGEVVKKNSNIIKKSSKKYTYITNLRILDLSGAYRLLYTLVNDEIEIISVILDWMPHKKYDKLNK
ncbi:MAG: hypothetical protein ACI83O_000654 [Patescibacteria group bacterium]|jgi:hypothetical protein